MIASILCPGPSLATTWTKYPRYFGPIIAVNRAVDFTACDWLVAGDRCTFDRIRGVPLRGVVAFNAALRDLPPAFQHLERIAWEDLAHPPEPAQWGIEAAILLAQHLASALPLTIRIFGCDQAGTTDWDGTHAADDRSPDRWARERANVAKTIAHVRHHHPTTDITYITP